MSTATKLSDKATGSVIFSLFGCASSSGLESRLKKLNGVRDVIVNYVTHTVLIKYDPTLLTVEQIRELLWKFGCDSVELR